MAIFLIARGNKDKNPELLAQSPTLRDYMYFVDLVRAFDLQTGHANLAEAIELTIKQCIRENVLKDFLLEHYTEVIKIMLWDFTFEHRMKLEREEGRLEGQREGRAEGIQKGADGERITAIRNMLELGLPREKILTKYSLEEYERAQSELLMQS